MIRGRAANIEDEVVLPSSSLLCLKADAAPNRTSCGTNQGGVVGPRGIPPSEGGQREPTPTFERGGRGRREEEEDEEEDEE